MNVVRKINPDIIHCQGMWTGIMAMASRVLLNKKYVIQGHGSDIYVPHKIIDKLKPFMFLFSSGILALSPDMIDKMHEHTKKHIKLFSNGINCKKFNKTSPNGNDIIFVGRLHEIKGVTHLIEALKYIQNDIKLHIIGDGDQREFLEKQASQFDNKVIFHGQKSNDKIPEYLSKSKIFVLPSLSEGQGLVLLEAYASWLPVIASNVGGIPTVVTDGTNGYLVPSKDPKAIAEKIDYLIDNPDIWIKMSHTNGAIADHYDITYLAKKLEKYYEEAL